MQLDASEVADLMRHAQKKPEESEPEIEVAPSNRTSCRMSIQRMGSDVGIA